MNLNTRDQQIFSAIMRFYCDGQGVAVPSSRIAKQNGMAVCSATIRNSMARMEKLGLIYSPHTSAGRVPTLAGFKYWFDTFFDLQHVVDFWQPCNDSLIQFTHYISQKYKVCACVGLPQVTSQAIFRVEVLDFDKQNWLILLLDRQGQSHNVVITKPLEANEKIRLAFNGWLNTVFAQQTLAEGLQRMRAMSATAPMFCHGSLAQWTRLLADKLGSENSIVVGDNYLFESLKGSEQPCIGTPLLSFVEDKLAFKRGLSVILGDDMPFHGFEHLLILSAPYFSQGVYQGRFCIICKKTAEIEALINEFTALG
ncbi:HrcA family transcriptional regulator [Pseudoalteromonas tunicata]|uniref:HrcA family transcriptional regulator n=1 Tax=Pseudoalteromonas tunicata TaxID=314281 RepID=UPI00273D4DBD|nr:HrcA family transcriptional regulator [Pseudoalteromonas tunicata]MDP4982374.1 HrcA family transcriptional regulator [Pseudoalteromonas tunicata]